MIDKQNLMGKMSPSQLVKKQLTNNSLFEQVHQKPRIIEFLNLADYSINTQSYVDIDQPLFEAIPSVISFNDYQPLQVKQKIFKLRNKDRFSRRVKIIQPDSKLFQILLPSQASTSSKIEAGNKVAAGMQTKFVVRFSPEAKIDYKYQLIVVTERQKFIVPIVAVGKRAMIDFPDILDFSYCPVKFKTQKPVIIRNLGQKTTKWNLQLPVGFSSNLKEGVLEPGKNHQILVNFYPTQARMYRTAAKLEYDKLQAYVELIGTGQLSNVYLSKTMISMEQSYIGLQSQHTLQIVNKSNVKVNFEWRAFISEKDEKPKKQLLYQQLQQQQAQQLMVLRQIIHNSQKDDEENNINDSSSEEEIDQRQYQQRKRKRAQLALTRKYKTIKRAIEDDLFLFQDSIFKIQPLVGEIWPNSQITVTVTFMPVQANTYDCMAYCSISCAEQRLPLKLKGEGLGPKAYLTQQQINFGDIFVNQPIKQSIQIQNRGEIPCHFTLQKPQRAFAKMFDFSLDQCTLQVGQNCSFEIKFKSSIPGEFKQKFKWQLHGSQRNLQMTFLGHVIAPTFEFVDPSDTMRAKPELLFGKISYEFDYKQEIMLKNTSSVEFAYNLKILNQNKNHLNEFRIIPQSGIIMQKSQKIIEIYFTPKSIKKYQTVMTIDIQGVGNDMLSVPIKADCLIPKVDITPAEKIQFIQACLNFPETKTIILKNNSDIKAKFDIVPQSQESNVLAKYVVQPENGIIDQRQSKQLQITLITCKLGQITLPLYINIIGTNNNQPYLLNICANSDGPKVLVSPQELDFGEVEVLKDYYLKVMIINNSKIKAQFHAFTRQKISIFKPKIKHAFLQPGQKIQFDIICNADDASKFNDILHFIVKDGKDKDILLKAKGIGSTIYCQQNLQLLNFGTIYTHKTEIKQIFIQNRGRKSQKITWQRKKIIQKKKKQKDNNNTNNKIQQQQNVFIIDPEIQIIPPKYGRYYRFIACSQKKGKIIEQFNLMSQIGNQRKLTQLKILNIQGQFTQPHLIYSQKKILFKFIWNKNQPTQPLIYQLQLTSASTLPLNFNLKVSLPFSVHQENYSLQPGDSNIVKVSFDPNFKVDRVSGIVNGKINVVFLDHPHRQVVQLVAQLCFPNLKVQTSIVNFGAILNDTTKKITMLMKNISQMAVSYEWAFLDEQVANEQDKMNISSNSLTNIPINEIFDILPLSGKLDPNQIQEVEFIYNAQGGILYRATALCHVQGGPNYQIKLEGDSSLISGKINQKELDYGQIKFYEWVSQQIYIENTGKVTFEYKIDLETVKRKSFLQIIPMFGKVLGGQKQKLIIKICPTMPNIFQEYFDIQMGYYDPQIIKIKGQGIYPSLLCQFPRSNNPQFDLRLKQDMQKYTKQYELYLKRLNKDKNKKKDKEMKSIQLYRQQKQKELDKQIYCKMIQQQIKNYTKPQKIINNTQTKLYQNIYLIKWICDFNNVIIGTTQKKILKYKNVGQYIIQMLFDIKSIKNSDFKITPQKCKLLPGQQIIITVILNTKKNSKIGKLKCKVILQVKYGAKYLLELLGNLTVPQIQIDGNMDGLIDFGRVLCGQRKTITLRFLNLKEINCDWNLIVRDTIGNNNDKDNQIKYQLNPSYGKILSGSFQIVKVSFTPNLEKDFIHKFAIKIQQNPKILNLDLRGIGTSINLDLQPNRIKIGPVLPYNQQVYSLLEIINPTKYSTELISLDFDSKYKQNYQYLSIYQQLKNKDKKDKQRILFLPLRQIGEQLWPELIKQVNKYKRIKKIQNEILQIQNEQNKIQKQKQLQKLITIIPEIKYQKKINSDKILHLIIIGPSKCGKSYIAKYISKIHQRNIININQIVDWYLNNGSQLGQKITTFLQERRKQYQLAIQQRQKAFKKAGKKAKELEQKIGPANQNYYDHLPENLWIELIQDRISNPDCGAGCIFDNLISKHCVADESVMLRLIMKAVGIESLNIIIMQGIVPNVKNDDLRQSVNNNKQQQVSQQILKNNNQKNEQINQILFEIQQQKDEKIKKIYQQKLQNINKLIKNQLELTNIKLFKDPIWNEINKNNQIDKNQQENKQLTHLGSRQIIYLPIYCNNIKQQQAVVNLIPAPYYADPMKQPLPQPYYEEVMNRNSWKSFDSKLMQQFTIYTPKDKYTPYKKPEKIDEKRHGRRNQPAPAIIEQASNIEFVNNLQGIDLQNITKDETRWIIPAETNLKLLIKFLSKKPGNFETTLTFDNNFSLKKINIPAIGKTQFPILSTIPKNIFWNIKKIRPINIPQCYLSKTYIMNQNCFDFGPLLIGKNQQNKNQKQFITINSSTFKIINNGHYNAQIETAFLSSIIDNDNSYKKNIFIVSIEKQIIQIGSKPYQLRVWAIPDQAKQFKDQLIIMIKNNPNPLVIPMRCLGCKPNIEILEGSTVKFTRILLNQVAKQQIKIQNISAVPIKFRLQGCQALHEEFTVNIKDGKLRPNQKQSIQITFKAIKQQKFLETLKLVAQDIQNLSLISESKQIKIQAQAFAISIELKFPNQNTQNLLNFGDIRAGDFIDRTFNVKNIGLYNVKLSFIMKKKLYKQSFQIQPLEFQLIPNNSKDILIRFSSIKQFKLKTNNNNTDINMEILQGKTLEIHRSIPINVIVNSVFSNYSIVPLKNINFGPVQFNEQKTRNFEIKNQGLFEFNYSIFSNDKQEFRKQVLSNTAKEREAKLEAANNMGNQGIAGDKKGAKKQAKDAKKAPKGGKGGKDQGALKIGQWSLNSNIGTVLPDSSAIIEVTFTGNSQKLYEQKIAIDIQNRNPLDEPNGIVYEFVAQSCIPGIKTEDFQSIFQEQLVMPSQNNATNVVNLVKSNVFFVEQKIFNFGTIVPSKLPGGIVQRIKIENNNKIPCMVKFETKKKNPNSIEQFAFDVEPKEIKILAHEHQYIKIIFNPTIMAFYNGIFTAIVDNGQQQPKTHKLIFDLKGQGALPSIKVDKPKQYSDQRTILLKFPRTRIDKSNTQAITFKNDGSIPATTKFELSANDNFKFLDNTSVSLTPKSYGIFHIQFHPTSIGLKTWQISAQTLLNSFEIFRFKIEGQSYSQDILFQNLPRQEQDSINFDDCIIGQQKKINFSLMNNSAQILKFQWGFHQDFSFVPKIGHISSKNCKAITVIFKSSKTVSHKNLALVCETTQIRQNLPQYTDWDDSMKTRKFVSKSQFEWVQRKKQQQNKRLLQQAQNAKKGGKKQAKKPGKKEQKKQEEKCPDAQPGEQVDIAIEETLIEPQNNLIEKSQKSLNLKASAVCDCSKYQVSERIVMFLPTMMYTSRVHTISLKNTSMINMQYSCKIVSAETGKINAGFYMVSPHSGLINPGCDETFTIKFSPTQVEELNDRLLVISIKNLDPSYEKLIVQLIGEIQRPICHFQLAPSKYRQKKPDIQEKYNIIEFESLGTKVKNTKRFYVINPTALAYDFQWKKIDDEKAANSGFFRCSMSKGTILSGKKTEMIFQYTPDLIGTHESYWIFEIPSQKIIQYFLIVGNVVQPNVFFDIGKINFGPLLIGGKNKQIVTLKNLEDVPLSFNFDRQSIKGQMDSANSLQLQPMSGVVAPQSDTKIDINFAPKVSQSFNYNVMCHIKRRSRPICVNIKGIGYVLSHEVYLNQKMTSKQKNEKQEINFGNIFVNQSKNRKIIIENNGDFNFDFAVKTSHSFLFLKLSHEFGTVRKNQKISIDLQFQPHSQFAFKSNASVSLSIISGPVYNFSLRGTAKQPKIDFSFFNYDFGPCFVLKQPLPVSATLQIRNRDQTAMTIQSLYVRSDYLDVKIPSGQVVLPIQIQNIKNKKGITQRVQKNMLSIPIVFTSRQLIKYNEQLIFDINGLNKIHIKIKGQGIPLKLQLQKTQDHNVNFGITRVGYESHRIVTLCNNSKKKIQIIFDIQNQIEELKKMFISMLCNGIITIRPKQKFDIELIFKPKNRISPQQIQLFYKIIDNQQEKKLLNIFTVAHGIQMKLMQDTVGFGTVVNNSKITKTVQLSNFGDIGSKFQWDTTYCSKYFTILPTKGYLNAHQDILFNITFHPNVIDNDIKFKVKCSIDGIDSLYINLIGKCIQQPSDTIQQLKFQCIVRKQNIRKITLKNPTNKLWKIKVSISYQNNKYNYFNGKQFIQISANSQADYDIIYHPLTMTKNADLIEIKQQAHYASLFFPIPDGSALMYRLVGTTQPPQPIETYQLNTKAKINLVHMILIQNWLKNPQRFNVSWIFEKQNTSVFINAATIFDIAGDAKKDYKLSIYALKACNIKLTLYFKNPQTFEFISYKINLTATVADPMREIVLTSLVRESTHKLITLENPLSNSVELKKQMITIQSDVIYISPNNFIIPAQSQFGLEVIFRPLLAKSQSSRILIKSPDLGQFIYPLKLTGNPSTSQRTMAFKTNLGSQLVQKYKFTHYGKKPTTYNCRIEKLGQKVPVNVDPKSKPPSQNIDFTLQANTLQVPGTDNFEGIQATVNVKFEPSSMNQSVCQLILTSADSGQYISILNGYANIPQPKGPFKISGAKPAPIQLKNPFFQATQFIVRIDNPSFTTAAKSPIKVDGKKVLSINLAYKAIQGTSTNGKLTVSVGENLSWVFYLQGE